MCNVAHDGTLQIPWLVACGLKDLKAAHKEIYVANILHIIENIEGISQEKTIYA
jgi:hypothetical protein